MKIYTLKIQDENNQFHECLLFIIRLENKDYKLKLEIKDISFEVVDTFQFIGLQKIRILLEKKNLKIFCKGSRIDVYPSGGLLGGSKAYILTKGKSPSREDFVSIYDIESDITKIVTVNEQKEFYNNWLLSLQG